MRVQEGQAGEGPERMELRMHLKSISQPRQLQPREKEAHLQRLQTLQSQLQA